MRAAWARECVTQAAATKESMAEGFVMEEQGQAVLLRLAFSPPQAGRASVAPVRVALAVFALACP
jgi:hypothetical protein